MFDNWYASAENLKLVQRLGLTFFTTLESNRMGSLSKAGGWIHLEKIDWTAECLQNGVRIKLKEGSFKVRLFKVVATDGKIDWVSTLAQLRLGPRRPLKTRTTCAGKWKNGLVTSNN